MRAVLAGETVMDSRRGVLVYETGAFPTHFFPLDDFRRDCLVAATGDPQAGGQRWSLRVVDNWVTASPRRSSGDELLRGYVTLELGAVDRWFEEDDPIHAHPRDPYHRVDVRSSSRYVVVRHHGRLIAESHRPKLVFETGNPMRYYLPFADARIELLQKSDTVSECPYKGDGQHWHSLSTAIRSKMRRGVFRIPCRKGSRQRSTFASTRARSRWRWTARASPTERARAAIECTSINRWWTVPTAGLAILMTTLDMTVVNMALPRLSQNFGARASLS
jgi:uncharacterized protein (DUF427 family)